MKERTKLLIIVLAFVAAYYVPWGNETIRRSGLEAFMMLQEYAREHVLTCLIPAFFIAGAIAVFVSQASVLKYFGATANKILSYSVASSLGYGPGGLLLHRAAPLCRDLHEGRRHRSGHGVLVFRSCHQCAGHRPDRADPGVGNGPGQGRGRGALCGAHGPADGLHLPEGRCGPNNGQIYLPDQDEKSGPSPRTPFSCSPWCSS